VDDPRPQAPRIDPQTADPVLGVAVLTERLAYAIEKIDAVTVKLDAYHLADRQHAEQIAARVSVLERQVVSARSFVVGLAVAAGAVGGGAGALVSALVGS
jgi:hypothetical protein